MRRRRRLLTLVGVIGVSACSHSWVRGRLAPDRPPPVPTGTVNSELPWHAGRRGSTGETARLVQASAEPRLRTRCSDSVGTSSSTRSPIKSGTKLKTYLVNSVFDGDTLQGAYWQSNPAMTFGSFVDSALAWYPYSGDRGAIRTVGAMLHYALAHGTTPASWSWASVPFPTGCGNRPDYGRCLSDMPKSFYGGIEPDKVGELGIGYALFYEMTGNRSYLEAAVHCADALAAHVRPGDDTHTPWAVPSRRENRCHTRRRGASEASWSPRSGSSTS